MIVDTSAVLTVLLREAEPQHLEAPIAPSACRMPVAAILEASMVLHVVIGTIR